MIRDEQLFQRYCELRLRVGQSLEEWQQLPPEHIAWFDHIMQIID